MAKRRAPTGHSAAPSRGKTKQPGAISSAIPIVAGLVVLIVAVGMLLSLRSWRSSPAGSAANATALPLSTRQISYPEVPRISVEQAQKQLARREILMVDVRSKASYDQLHIEGAVSMPEGEILDRLDELDSDRDIVLYCT
jgi:hypothetical protein